MVQGLVDMGWIKICADFLMGFTNGNLPLTATLLIWVSGILSTVIDNIPYVATMIPMVQDIAFHHRRRYGPAPVVGPFPGGLSGGKCHSDWGIRQCGIREYLYQKWVSYYIYGFYQVWDCDDLYQFSDKHRICVAALFFVGQCCGRKAMTLQFTGYILTRTH
jgi:hypothetical protein